MLTSEGVTAALGSFRSVDEDFEAVRGIPVLVLFSVVVVVVVVAMSLKLSTNEVLVENMYKNCSINRLPSSSRPDVARVMGVSGSA